MIEERGTRRLRTALLAYPRGVRQQEGDVLVSLAHDMVDGGQSSVNREAIGMLGAGLVARAGDLADLPWEAALRRIALPIAAALLAIFVGNLIFWAGGFVWPGWSWSALIMAPALAVIGLLAGKRLLLAVGALMICFLGLAQGNGLLLTVSLDGSVNWVSGGWHIPFLASVIPAGLLLLAASLCPGRRASTSTILTTIAWVIAGVIPISHLPRFEETIGATSINGLGICMVIYGTAMVLLLAVGLVRRRRDPAGMLTGLIGVATIMPVVLLYGVSSLPLGDNPLLLLFAFSAVATTAVFVRILRLTPA